MTVSSNEQKGRITMKYFTHNLLRILGALILVAAASSVTSTMAQTTITPVTGGGLEKRDAANQFTLDGETAGRLRFRSGGSRYHVIPGTRWVTVTPTGHGFPGATIRYRATFQLPPVSTMHRFISTSRR